MRREMFGLGTVEKLQEIIAELNPGRILIVCGETSFERSGAKDKIMPQMRDRAIRVFYPTSNPSSEIIKAGIEIYRSFQPNLVIAVGGGSVIDSAKAINALANQDDDALVYITGKKDLELEMEMERRGKPLIAIPTTSGTGSEVTRFCTIYVNKKKYSLADARIIPDMAIIDPSLTFSLPPYITAYTGLDALCQGIESYWAISSTEESREYAQEAVELAFNHLRNAVKNGDDAARIAMAKAAHLSGKAITISKTTACHSISYPLTAYFGIPHGHAVALTMPAFLAFNAGITEADCNDSRGVGFVRERLDEIFSLIGGAGDGEDARRRFDTLLSDLLEKTRLRDFGIFREDMELIVRESFTPSRMNNNPRRVTKEVIRTILEDIW